jgi:hypothetical protein
VPPAPCLVMHGKLATHHAWGIMPADTHQAPHLQQVVEGEVGQGQGRVGGCGHAPHVTHVLEAQLHLQHHQRHHHGRAGATSRQASNPHISPFAGAC